MKKFLTVLLALSVVFTYTVGTAFAALPSDSDDAQAGLAAKKAEAVKELESYGNDLSDYTTSGQTQIKGVIAEYTDIIESKNVTTVKAVEEKLQEAIGKITAIKNNTGKLVVAKAVEDAKTQLGDYQAILTGPANKDALVLDAADKSKLDDTLTKIEMKLDGALSLDDVAEYFDEAIVLIDKYASKLYSVEITDTVREQLVKGIREYADKTDLKTPKYSTAIVAKYADTIEEAVAAAKNAKTWGEVYDIVNKYLGSEKLMNTKADGYVKVNDSKNYVLVYSYGELNKLANMTAAVEAQLKAAKLAQQDLGDYDYKAIAEGKWADAEEFRTDLADFIETAANAPVKLAGLTETSTASQIRAAADDLLADYAAFTKLADAKTDAIATINSYLGYELDGSEATLNAYLPADQKKIEDARNLYKIYVEAATTVEQVEGFVAKFEAKVDSYNTADENFVKENKASVAAAINEVVAAKTADMTLTADQKALLNRVVTDLNDKFAKDANLYPNNWEALSLEDKVTAAERFPVKDKAGNQQSLSVFLTVSTGLKAAEKFTNDVFFGYTPESLAVNSADYTDVNYKKIGVLLAELEEVAEDTDTTWAQYLDAYDAKAEAIDAIETKAETAYADAVKKAEEKIAALVNPEYTTAFNTKLVAAKTALDAVEPLVAGLGLTDEEVAALAGVSNEDAYYEAKYEYEYQKHLVVDADTAYEPFMVGAYKDIATALAASNLYSAANKAAILEIITKADDALDAAKTEAEQVEIAEKAIAELKAIVADRNAAADAADYAEKLAAFKADATRYFAKYYNATFAPEATTCAGLVDEIVAFNAQFYKAVEDGNAYRIQATKAMKVVKCHSKLGKGYIRVYWSAEGDETAIDGFQVYKSTKAQSGYTYMGKTTKHYMTNKKGLKKGKRFYYKVRAYVVVDGVKYYSDWSNKANRIYK